MLFSSYTFLFQFLPVVALAYALARLGRYEEAKAIIVERYAQGRYRMQTPPTAQALADRTICLSTLILR